MQESELDLKNERLKRLDPKKMTSEESEALANHLFWIMNKSFERQQYDANRLRLQCALKQKTVQQAFTDGALGIAGISKDTLERTTGIVLDENYKPDEFSNLYNPTLLKASRILATQVGNIVFPLNGDTIGINRRYCEFFDKNLINDFLPQADESIQTILETENRNFQFQSVYESVLVEGLNHAFWSLDHEYDDQLEVVEPVAPGGQNVGIYPLQSDWRKSNRCFYVDVNFNQLLERPDLDQGLLEQIRPKVTDQNTSRQSSIRGAHHNAGSVPFGKVRLIKFHCPSVYFEKDGTSYIAEGLYAVALINPDFIDGTPPEGTQPLYVLKLAVNVPQDRSGLQLGTPVVNEPNEFFNSGIMYPWLAHQLSANGFYSAATRLASYLTKGPFNEEKTGFNRIDTNDEDMTNGFHSFQVLKGKKYTPVFSAEFINFIEVAFTTIQKLEDDTFSGIGIGRGAQGLTNDGRNTKDEVLKAAGSGDMTTLSYAVRFNNQIYVPSLFTRWKNNQAILAQQVAVKMDEVKQLLQAQAGSIPEAQALIPDDNLILEQVLDSNKLFNRLVNTGGYRQKYREFYKKRQKQILENEAIALELKMAEQEVMSMYQFAKSPVRIEEYPPAPAMPVPVVNKTTGQTEMQMHTLTPAEEQQRREAWVQSEQQRRFQAGADADAKMLDIKKKQLMITPVDEIPELSNVLIYQIIMSPIEESDIVIPGVVSAILKGLRDEEIGHLVNLFSVIPEDEIRKFDFGKFMTVALKGNTVTKDSIMKDEETILREEEAAKQEAEYQRQVDMELLKRPGAQPPTRE